MNQYGLSTAVILDTNIEVPQISFGDGSMEILSGRIDDDGFSGILISHSQNTKEVTGSLIGTSSVDPKSVPVTYIRFDNVNSIDALICSLENAKKALIEHTEI